jgi:hypothetical protein
MFESEPEVKAQLKMTDVMAAPVDENVLLYIFEKGFLNVTLRMKITTTHQSE